jgi:hypothetical protein
MNSRTDAIWLFSEMNSKSDVLTVRSLGFRDAPAAA